MRRLVLAAAAIADLKDIAAFTLDRWGAGQKRRYFSALNAALRRLRRNPMIGRRRPDLGAELYSFLVARHVIFYRFDDLDCEIVRILHDRMDVHRVTDESPDA